MPAPAKFLALLLGLAAVGSAAAGPAAGCGVSDTAANWLQRMSDSLRQSSHRGELTYEHGMAAHAMRVSHAVGDGSESSAVTAQGGAVGGRHLPHCNHPSHRLLRLAEWRQRGGAHCGVADHYRLQMADRPGRVAGREAVTMRVLPRDFYRHGYQMELDTETGLLLRSQTITPGGQVLERFQYSSLTIDGAAGAGRVAAARTQFQPKPQTALQPESKIESQATLQATSSPAESPSESQTRSAFPAAPRAWRVSWVPDGFIPAAGAGEPTRNKTYTDGLASFTVFLEAAPTLPAPGEGRARQGGAIAYTRGRALDSQPVLITVLGEVPVRTARMVADSVRWGVARAD